MGPSWPPGPSWPLLGRTLWCFYSTYFRTYFPQKLLHVIVSCAILASHTQGRIGMRWSELRRSEFMLPPSHDASILSPAHAEAVIWLWSLPGNIYWPPGYPYSITVVMIRMFLCQRDEREPVCHLVLGGPCINDHDALYPGHANWYSTSGIMMSYIFLLV